MAIIKVAFEFCGGWPFLKNFPKATPSRSDQGMTMYLTNHIIARDSQKMEKESRACMRRQNPCLQKQPS